MLLNVGHCKEMLVYKLSVKENNWILELNITVLLCFSSVTYATQPALLHGEPTDKVSFFCFVFLDIFSI